MLQQVVYVLGILRKSVTSSLTVLLVVSFKIIRNS